STAEAAAGRPTDGREAPLEWFQSHGPFAEHACTSSTLLQVIDRARFAFTGQICRFPPLGNRPGLYAAIIQASRGPGAGGRSRGVTPGAGSCGPKTDRHTDQTDEPAHCGACQDSCRLISCS